MNARPFAALGPLLATLPQIAVPVAALTVLGVAVWHLLDDDDKPEESHSKSDSNGATRDSGSVAPRASSPVPALAVPPAPVLPPSILRPVLALPVAHAAPPASGAGHRGGTARLQRADVQRALASGACCRKEAVRRLRELTGCGQTAAYNAFSPGGRFSDLLREDEDGRLSWAGTAPATT